MQVKFRPAFLASLALFLVPWIPSTAVAAAPATYPLSERVREGDDYYLGRQRLENVRRALELLRGAVAETPSDYEAWWRLARSACYLARHTPKPEKMRLLQETVAAGKRAVALAPKRVEGHFWLGAGYGLMAEERNFVKALMLVDPIRQEMVAVVRLDPDY